MSVLRKLTFVDGAPFWVNPRHVVSLEIAKPSSFAGINYDGPAVTIHLVQPGNGWLLRGTLDEVAEVLNSITPGWGPR